MAQWSALTQALTDDSVSFTWSELDQLVGPPGQLMAPYDRYLAEMSESYRAAWGSWTVERLALLAGPLDGRVVEVHAGASYVDAIARPLADKGAQLINRLGGLRQGERQAWYGAHTPEAPRTPTVDVGPIVSHLLAAETGRSPTQFLGANGADLKVPGLYDRRGAICRP